MKLYEAPTTHTGVPFCRGQECSLSVAQVNSAKSCCLLSGSSDDTRGWSIKVGEWLLPECSWYHSRAWEYGTEERLSD